MTYPVDDLGNPRVDFVWGQFPIQPNDQRTWTGGMGGANPVVNQNQNNQWSNWPAVGSLTLNSGWTELSFPTGDGGSTRTQTFTWDNHEIAVDNYENYPGFTRGYPYDNIVPNVTVPNILGLSAAAAYAALNSAGLPNNNDGSTTDGATALNDGKVSYQSVPAGTVFDSGDAPTIHYQTYHYVSAPATTGPIAGFNRSSTHFSLNGNEVVMYVTGRTVKPTVSTTITVSGTSEGDWNQNWTVEDIANDDAYNTGGTAVKLAYVDHVFTNSTSSGGTWTLV